jgi:hypothetical protein
MWSHPEGFVIRKATTLWKFSSWYAYTACICLHCLLANRSILWKVNTWTFPNKSFVCVMTDYWIEVGLRPEGRASSQPTGRFYSFCWTNNKRGVSINILRWTLCSISHPPNFCVKINPVHTQRCLSSLLSSAHNKRRFHFPNLNPPSNPHLLQGNVQNRKVFSPSPLSYSVTH